MYVKVDCLPWLLNKIIAQKSCARMCVKYVRCFMEWREKDDMTIKVANHSQRVFSLIQHHNFSIFQYFNNSNKNILIRWEWLATSIGMSLYSLQKRTNYLDMTSYKEVRYLRAHDVLATILLWSHAAQTTSKKLVWSKSI